MQSFSEIVGKSSDIELSCALVCLGAAGTGRVAQQIWLTQAQVQMKLPEAENCLLQAQILVNSAGLSKSTG